MASQNSQSTSAGQAAPSSPPDKSAEEEIRKLTEEKRILEEKNKKLAFMLNICAKNASANAEAPAAADNSGEISELKEQLAALKKYVSEAQKKLEKTVTDQSSSQWTSVMNEMKSRFSSIDSKVATIDNIKAMQKKLDELEATVRDRKRRGGNPFGALGDIGGETQKIPEQDEDKELIDKIDELEQKIERLGNRISSAQNPENKAVEKAERVVHKIEGKIEEMIPGRFKDELAKISAVFHEPKDGIPPIRQAPSKQRDDLGLNDPIDIIRISPPLQRADGLSGLQDMGKIKAPAEETHIDIHQIVTPNEEEEEPDVGKLRLKIHEPQDPADAFKIQEDIRAGNLLLINIKSLKENDMELLKKIVAQAKRTCYAVDGNITGVGDNHLVVMPKNVQLHKEEIK